VAPAALSVAPVPRDAPAIELVGISKSFGTVRANEDIDLRVARGTIHGIVGENGAGKSTLMSILYGFYQADAGEIRIGGVPTPIPDSDAAINAGIGMVHQHFMLVEPFTVLENVVLGAEEGRLLRPSLAKARRELTRLAEEYELQVDPDAVVGELSVGFQQRVEILKALYRRADILILDEPTGVLTPAEADHLFRILTSLRDEGKTIVLITHKLREIMAVTDAVSVMRRGRMVATLATAETSPPELAELMVGRRVLLRVEKGPASPGPVVLEVEGLRHVDWQGVERLRGVSFELRAGEILGIAGVAGNGQSELLEVLAGIRPAQGGTVRFKGEALDLSSITSADDRRAAGIGHVPEDRHRRGLVMPFAEWENSCLGFQREARFAGPAGTMDRRAVRDLAREGIEKFDIRPPSCDLKTSNFSGGNQQKIVLSREIERDPDVLLVGQPTRGVDIGAIEFIHSQIVALRDRGKAILLVSVELDEIQALSDRIVVMFDGRISGARLAGETDERELGLLMAGIDPKERAA
jgi:general nucleoside transport system ATP-binding protein